MSAAANDDSDNLIGFCPRCRRGGRMINMFGDDPRADGTYAACDHDRVFWYVSPQWHHLLPPADDPLSRRRSATMRREYQEVTGFCPGQRPEVKPGQRSAEAQWIANSLGADDDDRVIAHHGHVDPTYSSSPHARRGFP